MNKLTAFEEDTVYWFPVNDDTKDDSVTIHRCKVPKGTPLDEGVHAVREFIEFLGCDADEVAREMGFEELLSKEARCVN